MNAQIGQCALVTPMTFRPCWADLDGDGIIGPADLADLLASWGTCPSSDLVCRADIAPTNPETGVTGDGNVGPFDNAQLLSWWGVCRCNILDGGGESSGGMDGPEGGDAGGPVSLDSVMWLMGFSSVDEFIEWSAAANDDEIAAFQSLLESIYGGS